MGLKFELFCLIWITDFLQRSFKTTITSTTSASVKKFTLKESNVNPNFFDLASLYKYFYTEKLTYPYPFLTAWILSSLQPRKLRSKILLEKKLQLLSLQLKGVQTTNLTGSNLTKKSFKVKPKHNYSEFNSPQVNKQKNISALKKGGKKINYGFIHLLMNLWHFRLLHEKKFFDLRWKLKIIIIKGLYDRMKKRMWLTQVRQGARKFLLKRFIKVKSRYKQRKVLILKPKWQPRKLNRNLIYYIRSNLQTLSNLIRSSNKDPNSSSRLIAARRIRRFLDLRRFERQLYQHHSKLKENLYHRIEERRSNLFRRRLALAKRLSSGFGHPQASPPYPFRPSPYFSYSEPKIQIDLRPYILSKFAWLIKLAKVDLKEEIAHLNNFNLLPREQINTLKEISYGNLIKPSFRNSKYSANLLLKRLGKQIIDKQNFYFLRFKRTRSNYYYTLTDNQGRVIVARNSGQTLKAIKVSRAKKMRKSLFNTRYAISYLANQLTKLKIFRIHKLILNSKSKLSAPAISATCYSFLAKKVRVNSVQLVGRRSHGLPKKAKKQRRI